MEIISLLSKKKRDLKPDSVTVPLTKLSEGLFEQLSKWTESMNNQSSEYQMMSIITSDIQETVGTIEETTLTEIQSFVKFISTEVQGFMKYLQGKQKKLGMHQV